MSVLNPEIPIYRFFEEISAIPRGSGNEEGISRYLVDFAKLHGLDHDRDSSCNVIIRKPGSAGREQEPTVLLQAHMDMVCEQVAGTEHDFEKDPLELYTDNGWLKARGTTLGADDGAGLCMILAILEDDTLSHPPLECLFTAAEEVGMDGARAVKRDWITAKRMIGLDGGGETCTCTTSSGGRRLFAHCPVSFEENTAPCYLLTLTGLNGGHSGQCIDKGLGNAIKLGFRILYQLLERGVDIRIVQITGGAKNNAIPREFAVLFSSAFAGPMLERYVQNITSELKAEYSEADPGLEVTLAQADTVETAMRQDDTGALITMGYLLPNGLVMQSEELKIPVISRNIGVLTQSGDDVVFDYLLRSPWTSAREQMSREIEAISSIFGGYIQLQNDYDGWSYEKHSPMREALRQVLRQQGQEMTELASHGGLETGIFKGRYPKLDIITYGPIAFGCHTPEEKLDLESFQRSYRNLTYLLKII